MPLKFAPWYTREDLRMHPHSLFVFGDNLLSRGYKGQAAACRGEPNAVGIPTKRYPSNHEGSFLCDDDLPDLLPVYEEKFLYLGEHIKKGEEVIWPADGIGTGLAQLKQKAPAISKLLDDFLDNLRREELYYTLGRKLHR